MTQQMHSAVQFVRKCAAVINNRITSRFSRLAAVNCFHFTYCRVSRFRCLRSSVFLHINAIDSSESHVLI